MSEQEKLSPVLKLKPGSVSANVIVCGDPARALTIAQHFDSYEKVAARREFVVYTGKKNGCPITVAAHGVGAAGAAICFEELILYGAKDIIRIGTAGSYDDTQDRGNVIIATGATSEDGVSNTLVPAGFPCVCDVDLVKALIHQAKGRIGYKSGVIRTKAAFYPGVLEDKAALWAAAGAAGVEMELVALLAVASIRRVRAAGIFVIDGFPLGSLMREHDQADDVVAGGMEKAIEIAIDALTEICGSEGNKLSGNTIKAVVDYTMAFKDKKLDPAAVKKAKELIIDTLGVSVSGWKEPSIAKVYASVSEGTDIWEASAWGTGRRLPLEWAVICNGSLVRVQDYMDIYYAADATHPSEYIPFVFCCCEALGLSGEQALRGILLAYDIQGWFTENIRCNFNGWHYATAASAVCAAVMGMLLGCSDEKLSNMIAINCSCNYTNLGTGPQTDMKTLAFALAAANTVKAAKLAFNGIQGPMDALDNLFLATGNADVRPEPLEPEYPHVFSTSIKPYPSEFMAHSALEALDNILSKEVIRPEDIKHIRIAVHNWATWIARECSYNPMNREEADHSLPYCIASRLVFGKLTTAQFQEKAWENEIVRALMSRITVKADPVLEALYPKARPAVVTITLKNGREVSNRVDYPVGDRRNPMTYQQVLDKFHDCVKDTVSNEQAERLIDTVNNMEDRMISELMELMKWTDR